MVMVIKIPILRNGKKIYRTTKYCFYIILRWQLQIYNQKTGDETLLLRPFRFPIRKLKYPIVYSTHVLYLHYA